jgi:hypothetical protein
MLAGAPPIDGSRVTPAKEACMTDDREARDQQLRRDNRMDEPATITPPADASNRDVPERRPESVSTHPAHTTLIDPAMVQEFERRWSAIQADFVEDPQRSVAEAGRLISEVMDRISADMKKRVSELGGGAVNGNTEAMRIELQQYRGVFQMLMHNG